MTTDHRLQFTEAKNLALRVISTKTRHLFSFFFYFPLFYFATLCTIWQVLWIRIDICGVNIEAGKRESLVCRPLIILTRELFYHQNERTRFNGFSSCVLTIKLVPRITMLINIHITLKHIFGFKDSIFWPFASVNGFEFKDNGPNEWKTILFNVQMKCLNLLTSLEYFLYSNNVLLFEALKELLYRINCLVLVQLICKIVTKWKPILNILF